MIVLIPPGAGYDEEDHLVRVWELSAFSFIPGEMSPQEMKYPTVFRDFAYRQQGSKGIIGSNFWQSYVRASLYERGFVRREIDTKSVYSPAILLPQAIILRLFGRSADLPALIVFYLCRLAGFLSYLGLVWLAVRWIPVGKWILLLLAASPMTLFQAATITPDAISNGIGFLFVAGCLRVAQSEEIGWRATLRLVLLILLLFLAKLNLIALVLLPFLLIPRSKFSQPRMYVFLLVATLLLFTIEVAGWNIIAGTRSTPLLANEANPTVQTAYIVGHPLTFFLTTIKDLITNGWTYFQGWMNGYGYYYWTPPLIVSLLFLLSLGSVLLMDSTSEQLNHRVRVILLLVFVAGYLATIVSLYLSFTPVGSNQIFGVQGRYFVPLTLPLFLALSGFFSKKKTSVPSPNGTIIFLSAALSLNLLGIFFSFHVPCGSTFYQTGLCYRPLFKDFPSNVRPSPSISNEIALRQEIQVMCDGFAEVRILLTPSRTENKGTTHFVLKNPLNDQTLLDTSLANEQVRAETWYPLRFEPDWGSAGKQYVLKVTGTNISPTQGLQLLYTPQPEFNLGNSYENRQLLQEDLVLQYGCLTGLRKIWLTGRP